VSARDRDGDGFPSPWAWVPMRSMKASHTMVIPSDRDHAIHRSGPCDPAIGIPRPQDRDRQPP
jgi:hypothetical protein